MGHLVFPCNRGVKIRINLSISDATAHQRRLLDDGQELQYLNLITSPTLFS